MEKVEAVYKKNPLVEQIWVYGNSFESVLVAVRASVRSATPACRLGSPGESAFQPLTLFPTDLLPFERSGMVHEPLLRGMDGSVSSPACSHRLGSVALTCTAACTTTCNPCMAVPL